MDFNNYFKLVQKDYFLEIFKEYLSNVIKLSAITIEKILLKVGSIVRYVNATNKNLLIVGNVQSGKTNTFLCLIASLFDRNTNFVFVLAGVDKIIYAQNVSRIKATFSQNVINQFLEIFDYQDFLNFKKDGINRFVNALKNDKKIIICCLKNANVMQKLLPVIKENHSYYRNPIIIDDEGDQFSFKDIKKYLKNNHLTPTNKQIQELFFALDKYTFISVTATPYAHILVEQEDKIKADYAFVLEKNALYLGVDFFNESICDNRDNIVEAIDNEEILAFKSEHVLGECFDKALIDFFYYGFFMQQVFKKEASMLINPGTKKILHEEVRSYLNDRLNILKNELNHNDFKLLKWLENNHDLMVQSEFYNKYLKEKILLAGENELELDAIKKFIIKSIKDKSYEINIVNSDVDISGKKKNFNFYIGSNKLSRGVTIDDLIISFIFRRAKTKGQSDTIYQMARWLGYRSKYQYLIKVYLINELIKDYKSIEDTNEDLLNILVEKERKKESIRDLNRKILISRTDGKLDMVRKSVSGQKLEELKGNKNFLYKERFFSLKWKDFDNYDSQVKTLIDRIIEIIKINPFNLRDLSEKIHQFPSTKFNSIDSFKNEIGFARYSKLYQYLDISSKQDFDEIIELNSNAKVIVTLMTKNSNDTIENYKIRMRKYDSTLQQINTLFEGQNETYCGDKYWANATSKNYLFLQMFPINIKIDGTTKTIYKLALIQSQKTKNLNDEQYYIVPNN